MIEQSILIILAVLVFAFSLAYLKKVEQLKRYRMTIDKKDEDIKFLTIELKEIMSFSKYAIERWEVQVKENKELNDKVTDLLREILKENK